MRRAWWICLTLVLVLAGGSTVCAQEDGFYVIPAMKGKYAPVPKTGQTTSYGPRDDGALQEGVAWPDVRFIDNHNGTVTDQLTGLIWMKDADAFGGQTWDNALNIANNLKSGEAGLTDGSRAGDWRLPNIKELLSLIDYSVMSPAIEDLGSDFQNTKDLYWSSTSRLVSPDYAWLVDFEEGLSNFYDKSSFQPHVWCVRGKKWLGNF